MVAHSSIDIEFEIHRRNAITPSCALGIIQLANRALLWRFCLRSGKLKGIVY